VAEWSSPRPTGPRLAPQNSLTPDRVAAAYDGAVVRANRAPVGREHVPGSRPIRLCRRCADASRSRGDGVGQTDGWPAMLKLLEDSWIPAPAMRHKSECRHRCDSRRTSGLSSDSAGPGSTARPRGLRCGSGVPERGHGDGPGVVMQSGYRVILSPEFPLKPSRVTRSPTGRPLPPAFLPHRVRR
jgi:hypothetical protein